MRFFQLMGTSFDGAGESGSAPPEPIPNGTYGQAGIGVVRPTPLTGQGWQSLAYTSSGTTVRGLLKRASALTPSSFTVGLTYQGNIQSVAFYYWNGTAWAALTQSVVLWAEHFTYDATTEAYTFTAPPSVDTIYFECENTGQGGAPNIRLDSLAVS